MGYAQLMLKLTTNIHQAAGVVDKHLTSYTFYFASFIDGCKSYTNLSFDSEYQK